MPMYQMSCPNCSRTEDRLVPMHARDTQVCHCGAVLGREITLPQPGRVDARYVMKGVTASGAKIPVDGRRPKGFGGM